MTKTPTDPEELKQYDSIDREYLPIFKETETKLTGKLASEVQVVTSVWCDTLEKAINTRPDDKSIYECGIALARARMITVYLKAKLLGVDPGVKLDVSNEQCEAFINSIGHLANWYRLAVPGAGSFRPRPTFTHAHFDEIKRLVEERIAALEEA